MIDLFDYAIAIGLLIIVLLTVRLAVGLAWAGWRGWHSWQVEHAARRIELRRLAADVDVLTVRPGEILLPREELSGVVMHQIHLVLAQIEAGRTHAPVPHTYHYSVTNSERPALTAGADVAALPMSIPSVLECYHKGLLANSTQLHVGFAEDGRPLFSPIQDTYGVAVAGVPGQGKSTGMRYWALQMAMHGAMMAMVDPAAHSSSGQGMAAGMSAFTSRLWEQPASEPDEIIKLLQRVAAMGYARNKGKDPNTWALMLMVDELNALVTGERGQEIADLLLFIARQYRKEHIYTMAAGQDWLGKALGPDVGLRRAFVCKAVYRVDTENARRLTVRKPLQDRAPELQPGQMVWLDKATTQTLVTVPNCTSADVATILGGVVGGGSPSHTRKELLPPMLVEGDGKELGRNSEGDGEVALDAGKVRQIKDYGALGWSTYKIACEVFGVDGGRGYSSACKLIDTVLKRGEP